MRIIKGIHSVQNHWLITSCSQGICLYSMPMQCIACLLMPFFCNIICFILSCKHCVLIYEIFINTCDGYDGEVIVGKWLITSCSSGFWLCYNGKTFVQNHLLFLVEIYVNFFNCVYHKASTVIWGKFDTPDLLTSSSVMASE